jgi:hypothetical protein
MSLSKSPKEGTARYYELRWNEWRDTQKLAGAWVIERKQRRLLNHTVPFEALVAELNVLARLLGSDLPHQLVREIEARNLVNEQRRWTQLRGESPEIRMILGRAAQQIIEQGKKADPAYAYLAWDCGIEAADFTAAKEQIRKAHKDYLASRAEV